MVDNANPTRELDRVNMLIRALSAEMAQQQTVQVRKGSTDAVLVQMREAMFQLRLRKLIFSAGLTPLQHR